ncbi:sensor domain-containing diguanylate cyclase [Caenispirillum salinarum]|uniref:sensor domain-containing diguanylate cyclase n=1 Tax=Caenispirillum salinarum TaxID=859058 RepID=UPI00068FAFD1|nr:diguanylate cyclase [Caenispirillum salinarum]
MNTDPVADRGTPWPVPAGVLVRALAECSGLIHDRRDWTRAVDTMLATVGRVTGTSRVWIFQTLEVTETEVVQDYIFEWAASAPVAQLHLKRFRLFRTAMVAPDYRALVQSRLRGESTAFLTRDLAPGSHLRDDMDSQAITAMATVPIMLDGGWWGTLGLDDCRREVPWSAEELDFLRTCADLIGALIHRQRLDDRTRQLAVLDSSAHSGVWDWAFDPGRLWCSDAFYRLLGYPPPYPKMALRSLLHHLAPDHREALMERVRRCTVGTSESFRLDVQVRTRGGSRVWWEVRADAERDADGRLKRIAGLALEITSRKHAEHSLRDAADTDPLTGALNRRGFETVAARRIAATDGPESLQLLALDIDHFKAVNDTYGHAVGDVALRAVAARVGAHLRDGDLLARVGGEEFAILLHGGPKAAESAAERIRAGIAAEPVDCLEEGGPPAGLPLTASLGVATFVAGEGLSGALKRADTALYAAKRAGRNRVVRAEGMAHMGAA